MIWTTASRSLAALGVAVVLGGCGTTVPLADQVAIGSELGGAEAPTPRLGTDAPADLLVVSDAGRANPEVAGTELGYSPSGTTSSALLGGDAPAARQSSSAPVVGTAKRTPLRIGIAGTDTAALAAAFGETASDSFAGPRKLIEHINKTGGAGGRKLEPVFFAGSSSADASTVGQQACTAFTEDADVEVVLSSGILGADVLASCLKRQGIALVDPTASVADAATINQHPNWFLPSAVRIDRYAAGLINASAQRGTLKRGDVLGVLVEDCGWASRVMSRTVEPVAKARGVTLVRGTFTCVENLVTDLAPVTTDVQREVLRFASQGVTDVIVLSVAEAFAVSRFTQGASQQRYFPTYIVTSNAYPHGNSQPGAIISISPDALANMTGLGYTAFMDVGPAARPKIPAQAAAQARCAAADPTLGGAMAEEGDRSFKEHSYFTLCDAFQVLSAMLTATGGSAALPDLARVYRPVLNGGLASAALVAGSFAVDDKALDGAGTGRMFAYDAAGKGFRYVDAPVRIG